MLQTPGKGLFLKASVKAKIMIVEHRHVEDKTCVIFFSGIIEIL